MSYRIEAARRRTILCTLVTTFAAACSDYTSPSAPTPAAIAVVSGSGQTGIVGPAIPRSSYSFRAFFAWGVSSIPSAP